MTAKCRNTDQFLERLYWFTRNIIYSNTSFYTDTVAYAYTGLTGQSLLQLGACLGVRLLMGLRTANSVNAIGTLEEILALRRVWITLRHQWGNCLSPDQGRVLTRW